MAAADARAFSSFQKAEPGALPRGVASVVSWEPPATSRLAGVWSALQHSRLAPAGDGRDRLAARRRRHYVRTARVTARTQNDVGQATMAPPPPNHAGSGLAVIQLPTGCGEHMLARQTCGNRCGRTQ